MSGSFDEKPMPAAQERDVLKARAVKLGREAPETEVRSLLEIVEFELAGESYGIALSEVREVSLLKELTHVPCTPPFVAGIISLRGEIVTVIDIKQFFELPMSGITDLNRVIVVRAEEKQLGILADVIRGARSIPEEEMQSSLPTLTGIRADYLRGVTGEQVIVLDAAKMLSDRRLVVYEEMEG